MLLNHLYWLYQICRLQHTVCALYRPFHVGWNHFHAVRMCVYIYVCIYDYVYIYMYRYILSSSSFACCLLQPCAQLLQLLAVGSSSKRTCIREACRKSQGSPRWEQRVISEHPRMMNASRGSSSHVLGWSMKTKWNHQQGEVGVPQFLDI